MMLKCESCIESWIFPTFFNWLLFIPRPRHLIITWYFCRSVDPISFDSYAWYFQNFKEWLDNHFWFWDQQLFRPLHGSHQAVATDYYTVSDGVTVNHRFPRYSCFYYLFIFFFIYCIDFFKRNFISFYYGTYAIEISSAWW